MLDSANLARWVLLAPALTLLATACEDDPPVAQPMQRQVEPKQEANEDPALGLPPQPEQAAVRTGGIIRVAGQLNGALDYDPEVAHVLSNIRLEITSPKPGELVGGDTISFTVNVDEYETKPGHNYIQVVIDDEASKRYYQAGEKPLELNLKDMNLKPGVHTIRAFPARPWHESVKSQRAFAATYFYYKEKTGKAPELQKPLLTYNGPVGTYQLTPSNNRILMDYFVSGAKLDLGQYKVRYTLNDNSPVTLTSWVPVWLEGLEAGKHSIQLELLDEQDKLANSPHAKATRDFEIVLTEDGA